MNLNNANNNSLISSFINGDLVSNELTGLAIASTAILGGAFYYYLKSDKVSNVSRIIDHNNQTREIDSNGARISNVTKTDKLVSYYFEDGKTLYELFLRAKRISNDGDFLGWRNSSDESYKWLKYSQVNEYAEQIGSALIHFGFESNKENFVGIYAKNRPEWVITETACNAYSFINVPLYDTLGADAIDFILKQTELRIVVCDDSEKALSLMKSKTNLEYIIIIEKINEETRHLAVDLGIKLFTLDEFKEIGQKYRKKPNPPKPDDLATICYTSGTTGTPKGAKITHANIVAVGAAIHVNVDRALISKPGEQESYISYLPLAHMFERISQTFLIGLGGKIGFYQGDIKKLTDDMKELKPTIFCTVPRLLNRIYAKVNENLEKSPAYKQAIFKWAFKNKEKDVLRGVVRNNGIYDFAFKQIRNILGGSVKFMFTGSAPASPEILHFLRVCLGCNVLEGYGATEAGGASSVQIPGETTVGNIGPPFACCLYKLVDVTSMNINAKRDNKGEICIKGNSVFKGYYKDEEKTREALDDDGWYHTGDIGIWETNGTLKIVDRVKNIFKLQQGEYVAPEKIENIYVRSKYVAQIFVYGNSYKSFLVGVVVPEEPVLFEWARDNNLEQDLKSLCENKDVKKLIMKDLEQQAKAGGLKGFEKLKDIHIHHTLFSIENGLLTPTMKSKRNELQKLFEKQLGRMNSQLD